MTAFSTTLTQLVALPDYAIVVSRTLWMYGYIDLDEQCADEWLHAKATAVKRGTITAVAYGSDISARRLLSKSRSEVT